MEIKNIAKSIVRNSIEFVNVRRGSIIDRKLVVIESDDWGAIRMPDRKTYERILAAGIRVDKSHYNKYDTLASKEDLEHLYEVLSHHSDKFGKSPVITANTIVANPDFAKIKASDFQDYYYEPFTSTLEKYNRSFNMWKEGIDGGYLFPQLHGREHLNIERWMRYLQNGSKEVHFCFENELFGIRTDISLEKNPGFVQAFDSNRFLPQNSKRQIITEAAELFRNIFSFNSLSFIAPNYIWDDEVESLLAEENIKYLQGRYIQKLPKNRYRFNFLGKTNAVGQKYLIRNVIFEPSSDPEKDWVDSALSQIENAFNKKKPAIICTHRVNFIGAIFEGNRINSLKQLDLLLTHIIKKWPDIEFSNSVDLGDLI